MYAFNTRILTIAVGNSDHAGNVNILLYYNCGLPTPPPTKLELATTNERQSCNAEVHSLISKTGLDYLWSVSLHCFAFPLTLHGNYRCWYDLCVCCNGNRWFCVRTSVQRNVTEYYAPHNEDRGREECGSNDE